MESNISISSGKDLVRRIKTLKKILKFLNIWIIVIGLIIIMAIGMAASSSKNKLVTGINLNLSQTTLQWQDEVKSEAQKQGVPELTPYIMAIIEVESKGVGKDIMQSSESAGLSSNDINDPLKSIEQGIKYLKNNMLLGKSLNFTDLWAIVQSYNFGSSYISHLATNNNKHSVEVAEEYSKHVVAPSLGNSTGITYSYINAVSQANGKTYLYANGGNFYYADLVRQYVCADNSEIPVGSKLFKTIIEEALKFQGNPYVWGGDNPTVGFDCSGLIQWTYAQAGINLNRTAQEQYNMTKEVSIKDAQPGDLIFFKGTYGTPDFISHVGIYVDETRMFDSNDSGIGYHYWTGSYWDSHFAGIRRIIK